MYHFWHCVECGAAWRNSEETVPLLYRRSLSTVFSCNSFGREDGENNGNKNARQCEGWEGPEVMRTFGIWISCVGFPKKCFHLIGMSILAGNSDFKYKTAYWLQPRNIHLSLSIPSPANIERRSAPHVSGSLSNLNLFQLSMLSSIFCCNSLHEAVFPIKCTNTQIGRQKNKEM